MNGLNMTPKFNRLSNLMINTIKIALFGFLLASLCSVNATAKIITSFSFPNGPDSKTMVCFDDVTHRSVECPDHPRFYEEGRYLVEHAYNKGDFDRLDTIFNEWCSGKDRFADGTWKLAQYSDGLGQVYSAWKKWDEDLKKIKNWQQAKPDSFAAKYAEAIFWRTYAWSARGGAYARHVSKESWEIFYERIGKADVLLEEIRPKAKICPAWYPIKINVMIDQGKKMSETRKIFEEGVKHFPEYHRIYFSMARAYEPKWGGSIEGYEAFANEAMKISNAFEGSAMYARLYWLVDYFEGGMPFDPEYSSFPNWEKLKSGYDDLMSKYPSSYWNTNKYASVACRAKDGTLYRHLRTKIDPYLLTEMFNVVSVDACDRRHNWKKEAVSE